jgi:streptogramin lyase
LPIDIAAHINNALVVVDADLKAIVLVDPDTGVRTTLSGCRDRVCSDLVGDGPLFQSPAGLAITAEGNLVVVDLERKAVVQVNPTTRQRTIVPGGTAAAPCIGRGGRSLLLSAPVDVAVERSTGHLVVVDIGHAAVLRVDAVTRDCTIIADGTTGSGPILQLPVGIAIEMDGHLVVADRDLQAVLRVDPATGNRLPVSAPDTGIGPLLQALSGLTIETDGRFVVGDTIGSALIRIDPVTGDRRVISHVDPLPELTVGTGPPLGFPRGITVESEDHLVLVDAALNAVVRVNAVTGDRTIISR